MSKLPLTLIILLLVTTLMTEEFFASSSERQSTQATPVEVFQVYELPIDVSGVELVKVGRAYELRSSIKNKSDEKLLGFRYSLVAIDSDNSRHTLANRSEAFALPPYETERCKIRMSLNFRLKSQHRLVLMFVQVVGFDSIWEVVKARDAFDAYLTGDYSVVPRVLRVANHVDAPPGDRVP